MLTGREPHHSGVVKINIPSNAVVHCGREGFIHDGHIATKFAFTITTSVGPLDARGFIVDYIALEDVMHVWAAVPCYESCEVTCEKWGQRIVDFIQTLTPALPLREVRLELSPAPYEARFVSVFRGPAR